MNRKMYKEFTELRLVQTLHAHEDAVWTMKFSHAGEYLATAGQDRIVRVWALDRERADAEPASGSSRGNLRLKGQNLFREKPHREYAGHRGDVLDLCWSHTDWLLSSSMDKTVRLWYMTMDECLRIFSHQDFVTAIDFNPVNDKYFLSGSLDGKLRFWNIPDHRVADWVDIGEMVTAATFNSDGSVAVAGSYKGKCHFYGMDGVRFDYLTHLDVRNSRSKKTQGKKITGLTFMPGDDRKLLVTSNDSRIRVYDGYALACKYKGHKNDNLLIRASFSPGAEFIVCGSEDENVYVWSTINSFVPSINPIYTGYRRDKHSSYESFAAQSDISTVALFAPEEVRRARTGRAAAEVAAARASVKTDIQATPAAAALFKGAPVSPMMDAACRGVEADGAGDDGAAGDDRPSDGTRESRRTEGAADARADPRAARRRAAGRPNLARIPGRRRARRANARSPRGWPSDRSSSPPGTPGRSESTKTWARRDGCRVEKMFRGRGRVTSIPSPRRSLLSDASASAEGVQVREEPSSRARRVRLVFAPLLGFLRESTVRLGDERVGGGSRARARRARRRDARARQPRRRLFYSSPKRLVGRAQPGDLRLGRLQRVPRARVPFPPRSAARGSSRRAEADPRQPYPPERPPAARRSSSAT